MSYCACSQFLRGTKSCKMDEFCSLRKQPSFFAPGPSGVSREGRLRFTAENSYLSRHQHVDKVILYYPSQRSVDEGFFRPSLRAVGFSLRFKNSGHVITFLWFNTDHVIPFWLFPPAAAKSGLPVSSFSRHRFTIAAVTVYVIITTRVILPHVVSELKF